LEKPEGKRPLSIIKSRWEDNIKMDIRETGWDVVNWTHLAQDGRQMEGSCEHGNEPSGSIKCWYVVESLSNWWIPKDLVRWW
jgi:hypothetical protein